MNKTRTLLSLGTIGLLALAAIAVPVLAKPGPGSDGPGTRDNPDRDRPALNQSERQDLRGERRDAMRDAHDQWQECKRAFHNETDLNQSMQEHCMGEKAFFLNATHARREAHALIGAIVGLERRLGRLEERKILLEQAMSNASLNETQKAVLQARIDKIQDHEEKAVAELQQLRDHLKDLDAKWESVREHIAERRHKGLDDGLEDHESGDDSGSGSDSESESGSGSA